METPVNKQSIKKELGAFLLMATIFSWSVAIIILIRMPPDFQTGNVKAVEDLFGNIPMVFGFGPFISAVLCTLYFKGKTGLRALFERALRWKLPFYWYLIALGLPIISQWIGLFVWSFITNTVLVLPPFALYFISWLQIALVSSLYFISEELGWRGFMLPRVLTVNTWIKASLVVGFIWSFWHYPIWVTSYWATTGSWSAVGLMVLGSTIFGTMLSILMTWIFKNTRESVLIAMIIHGSNNANMGKIYKIAGETALFNSGFLVVQSAVAMLLVIIFIFFVQRKISLK